ncbi:MAG: oligosaccharide repeat unit polymerase [Gemmatimonadaceae bacterium]|nr:oligosaccharide repeat unit polymerase [Gemmatimonadaceae bacterium]
MPGNVAALVAVTAFVGWCVWRAVDPDFAPDRFEIPQAVRDRAALLFVICWVPAIHYLSAHPARRRPIPFFCMYSCLYGLYYALSPMLGLSNLLWLARGLAAVDPHTEYKRPVNLLLAGWMLLLAGYWLAGQVRFAGGSRLPRPRWRMPEQLRRRSALVMLVAGLTSEIAHRFDVWPMALDGAATLLSMLLEGSIVALVALHRRGQLSRHQTVATAIGIAATIFLALGSSATGRVMFVLLAVFLGRWLGRAAIRPREVVAVALAMTLAATVRGVMTEWRNEIWGRRGGAVGLMEGPGYMLRLVDQHVDSAGFADAATAGWRVIGSRSANTDLLVDAMRRTPDVVPYWNGYSYRALAGVLVPRVVWPDKPMNTLGQEYGHRYAYLADSDLQTSINLPLVVEFYINFGLPGVLVGMFALGILLHLVEDAANRRDQDLFYSAMVAPILARLLLMECNFSLIFGALPLQLPSIWLIGMFALWAGGVIPRRRPPRPPWYAIRMPVAGARRAA